MKIDLNTKFELGQEVFYYDYSTRKIYALKVWWIEIRIDPNGDSIISYRVEEKLQGVKMVCWLKLRGEDGQIRSKPPFKRYAFRNI